METTYDRVMDIYVDYGACVGCEGCAVVYPELFEMRDGQAWVLPHGGLTPQQCEAIARICAFGAIIASD